MATVQEQANAKQVAKEVAPIVHPRVTMEIIPEQEKVLLTKFDSAGRESKIEFPFDKLGRELEFKGPLPVQVRTYWDEIAAGVKAGIHLQKKAK
jgi:hypothetical protein